jgi:hypothetical protein
MNRFDEAWGVVTTSRVDGGVSTIYGMGCGPLFGAPNNPARGGDSERPLPIVGPLKRILVVIGVLVALLSVASASKPAQAVATWQGLTYGSEHFEVPSTWPVVDLHADPSACVRFDRHAVYEGEGGPDPSCPPQALGVTEAVQIEPLTPLDLAQVRPDLQVTTIGGQSARVEADTTAAQRLVAELPGSGLLVTISYGPNPAVARAILASFRMATAAVGSRASAAVGSGPTAAVGSRASVGAGGVTPSSVRASKAVAGPSGAAAPVATPLASGGGVSVGPVTWTGLAFDACTAPSPETMAAWRLASPYRGVGVYIGGVNRACGDGYLSASWIDAEVAAGWNFVPLYVGRQASCADQAGLASISTSGSAGLEGVQAADDAVAQAELFGMGAGSPIYYDMESWDTTATHCSASVVSFVAAWDQELARQGYVSGIYGSADGGISQAIAPLFIASGLPRDVDIAEWDNQANTDSYYLPATDWPGHHRIKQFEGGRTVTFGGATINLDKDYVDSDVVGNEEPDVTSVSPTAASVGRNVVVLGQAFVPGRTTVSFGTVPSRAVTVTASTRLVARVPAGAMATVDVTVATSGGISAVNPADHFQYVPIVGTAALQNGSGYWVASELGNVFRFGAPFYGSPFAKHPASPIVGIATDAKTGGYWLVTASGAGYGYDAPWDGAPTTLPSPIVGMAGDAATGGYWLVTAAGNIYNYDAPFYGSTAGKTLRAPIVGIAADTVTGGYRLVTAAGSVYNFHALFRGSMAGKPLPAPIVGIAGNPVTGAYWLAAANGVVYPFGTALYGAAGPTSRPAPVVSITSAGAGYLLTTASGNVFNYNTGFYGSPAG